MHTTILLYPGFTALDAIGPYEYLSRIPNNTVEFVAKQVGNVVSDTGMLNIAVEKTLADISETEILVVPGGLSGTVAAMRDTEITAWIQAVHRTTIWTCSVCTGALILGAAGLLQGLDATTHWVTRDMLDQFGAVYCEQRYVQQGKIITAAGVSAGIDMTLYLIAEIVDEGFAHMVQLATEYDPMPPFDAGSPQKAVASVREFATQYLTNRM